MEDVPFEIIVPSFILSELTQGFFIGFIIYLPFIVIDMVVASILMAMGMMMLPPAMISMPFKILVFLMLGGWNYCIEFLIRSFIPV
jgi:flagellar biosynthetic protein FliP